MTKRLIDVDKIEKAVGSCVGGRSINYPVPIEQMVAEKGLEIKKFSSDDDKDLVKINGAIEYDRKTIWIDALDSYERQRFTIAHELGHAVLHPNENIIDYRIIGESSIKELEADEFAESILMPKDEVIKVKSVLETLKNGELITSLSNYFGVSMQAMLLRLEKLEAK